MNKKILIIEDESAFVKALVDTLRKKDYTLLTARDGKEGLSVALVEHPDMLLVDLLMPVMDGMTFLEILRNDSWGKTANVVILTNLTDEEKNRKAKDLGVSDYIIKADIELKDLIVKIKEKLQ